MRRSDQAEEEIVRKGVEMGSPGLV
jgi:hypothetical protein